MKTLETTFVSNFDLCGDNTFTQVKKENGVAIYRRERNNGTLVGYEVFVVKTRNKGDKLPGGAVEKEDRECYPGAAAFGKSAWSVATLERAEEHFDRLVNKLETATGKKPKKVVAEVVFPRDKEFTIKFLMGETGLERRFIRKALKEAIALKRIVEVGKLKSESGKGQPAIVYKST